MWLAVCARKVVYDEAVLNCLRRFENNKKLSLMGATYAG